MMQNIKNMTLMSFEMGKDSLIIIILTEYPVKMEKRVQDGQPRQTNSAAKTQKIANVRKKRWLALYCHSAEKVGLPHLACYRQK